MAKSTVKRSTVKQKISSLERQLSNANDALEASLSLSPERDNNFFSGGMSGLYEGRNTWNRRQVFGESLRAWRVNPIARRIVRLMTSFVIGTGLTIKCEDQAVQDYLTGWWKHSLNKFDRNVKRWKDEETRTGNLFFLYNVQEDGMCIIRAVPSEQIEEIITVENDVEQEIRYTKDVLGEEGWSAYVVDGDQEKFMLHFASNQPVGSSWGEAELTPLLPWIGRFSSWLEDRVRLNHFRTAFMYVISGAYESESERLAREKSLNANPPKSGSVLVTNRNNGEMWGTMSAQLDSFDSSVDGLAMKKMVASGVGFPLHWLAEPESATRTTAEAAGTPTFRTLEESQDDFFEMLISMARVALAVRNRKGAGLNTTAEIWIEGPDITERDNATLALALGRTYPHLADLLDRDGIEDKEFMRLIYKTFAEVWEGDDVTIKRKPLTAPGERADAVSPDDEKEPTDPKEDE